MQVLIVRLGAFGDIVHTLPLAADLQAAGHEVDWLCEDRWASLVTDNPAVRRVWRVPRAWWRDHPTPRLGRWRLLTALRQRIQQVQYDAVIDAQGLAKSAAWAWASGARRRLGHRRPRAREGAWLISRERSPCTATHVIDQQRALGLTLIPGACGGWKFPLPAWGEQQRWATQWCKTKHLTTPDALNVGAGWPSKVWPEHHQRDWCAATIAAGRQALLLWGSPAERELAERLHAAVPETVLAPDTDLPDLAALLKHVAVLVSGDTGPLHLARAVGTPAVGLFGPVPATRNGPRGPHWINLQAAGAAWERRDAGRGGMDQITVDAVGQAADSIRRA